MSGSRYERKITLKELRKAIKKHGENAIIIEAEKKKLYESGTGSKKRLMYYVPLRIRLENDDIVDIRYDVDRVVNHTAAIVGETENGGLKNKATIKFKTIPKDKLEKRFPVSKVSLTDEEKSQIKEIPASKLKEFFTKIGISPKKIDSHVEEYIDALAKDQVNELFEKWNNKQAKKQKVNDDNIKEISDSTNQFIEFLDVLSGAVEKRMRKAELETKELIKAKGKPEFPINMTESEAVPIFNWKKTGYKNKQTGEMVEYDSPIYKVNITANKNGVFNRTFNAGKDKNVEVNKPIIFDTSNKEAKIKVGDKLQSITKETITDYITRLSVISGIFELRTFAVSGVGLSFSQEFSSIVVKRNSKPYNESDEATKKLAENMKKHDQSDDEDETEVVLPKREKKVEKGKDKKKSERAGKNRELEEAAGSDSDEGKAKNKKKKDKIKKVNSDDEEPEKKSKIGKKKPVKVNSDGEEESENEAPAATKPSKGKSAKPGSDGEGDDAGNDSD